MTKFLNVAVFSAFSVLCGLQAHAQGTGLPALVVTNFGSFPLRTQTSLTNNDPGVNSSYSVVGGGNELWGPQDKGLFGFFETNGNFDVRVRVASLEPVHRYAKTGIMVRESLSSTARMVSLFATPTGPTELPLNEMVGEDQVEFNFRRGIPGGVDGMNNLNFDLGSPGYPNAWLRLARRGSVVYGLVSRDGTNWTKSASVDTATWPGGPLRPGVLLGLGSSSHDDNRLVRSELRDFSTVTAVGPIQISGQPANTFAVVDASATFNVLLNNPVDAAYQWFANGTLIPGATNATYTTPTLTAESDSTRYTVRVTGPGGTVTSSEARLTIVPIQAPEFPILFFDFDDGEVPLGTTISGTADVDPTQGVGGGAGLVLTRAANNQNGSFVIEDFNGFAVVDSFTVAFKLKIGPGSATPADGFSFSFGTNIPAAIFPAPQQGVGPGLAVSFDLYDNGELEAPALDVFYGVDPASVPLNLKGNILHRRLPISELLTSRYVEVVIRMNPDGKLDILYDGEVIAYQLQTPFVPVAGGKFGFGAFAGGQNAFHGIDDVRIDTTTSTGGAYLSSISPLGNNISALPEIRVNVVNQDTSLDTNTVTLQLNGVSVIPSITADAETSSTTLAYTVPSFLPGDSTNTITFIWSDTAGTRRTNIATFRVGPYGTLPASLATPMGSGNVNARGFRVRLYQIVTNLVPNLAFADALLAGQRGANVADLTVADPSGFFLDPAVTGTINYNVNAAPLGFSTFPGIPGLTDSKENFASEIRTFIEFPRAGFYQMGIRTDDGFRLTTGPDDAPITLGSFNGEREPSDTIFGFVVPQPGLYPFHLVYFQAGGGGSVRWFSLTETGEQVLVNDSENPKALLAFQTRTGGGTVGTRITFTRTPTTLTLSWTGGVLETKSSLSAGAWTPVPNAASPHPIPTTGTSAFFRVRQ